MPSKGILQLKHHVHQQSEKIKVLVKFIYSEKATKFCKISTNLYYELLNSNISADFKLCNLLYWKILKAKHPKSELLPKSAWNQSNFSIKTPKERNLKFEKDKWILSFWLCCPQPVALTWARSLMQSKFKEVSPYWKFEVPCFEWMSHIDFS